MENLDIDCAEFGQNLSGIDGLDEKLLQDGLSVLEEQGLYAFFLYLRARGKEPGRQLEGECRRFLSDNPVLKQRLNSSANDAFAVVRKLSESIEDILFARDLLTQALIYARYHLKAKEARRSNT